MSTQPLCLEQTPYNLIGTGETHTAGLFNAPDITPIQPIPPNFYLTPYQPLMDTTKVTNNLLISNIPMDQLQQLQQLLAECGPIKSLDTKRLTQRLISL